MNPSLNNVAAALPHKSKKDSIPTAHHCLLVDFVSKAEAWHEVFLRSLIQPSTLSCNAGEAEAASYREQICRNLLRGILRIVPFCLRLDRLCRVVIEATHAAIESLSQRAFELVSQAEIQSELRAGFPVVV